MSGSWPRNAHHLPAPEREHGQYYAGMGWYDASRRAFLQSASQITPSGGAGSTQRKPLDGIAFRSDTTSTEDSVQTSNAALFTYNPRLEQAEKLKTDNPVAFGQLSPGVRMDLGYYKESKAAAKRAGVDTSDPDAA